MVSVTLNRYRFGIITGILTTIGIFGLVEGVQVLVFGGLLFEWTTQRAMISVGVGVFYIALAVVIHQWIGSVVNVMNIEEEPENNEI